MNWRKVALIGTGLLIGVILLFDLVMLLIGGTGATVSVAIYTFSKSYPLVPFLTGMIAGHLFFPMDGNRYNGE